MESESGNDRADLWNQKAEMIEQIFQNGSYLIPSYFIPSYLIPSYLIPSYRFPYEKKPMFYRFALWA
jgi:hypothetical protein